MLRIFAAVALLLLSNACTKLKNRVFPVSYSCGQEAKDWSDRFIKVYDSGDSATKGADLSAQLNSTNLLVSEKGCVMLPDGTKTGLITIRDNRPAKQEGKIFSVESLTYPASVRLDVLSAIVPQISCQDESLETSSTKLDVSVDERIFQNRDRYTLKVSAKQGEQSNAVSSVLDGKTLHVELGKALSDGEYQLEIAIIDALRNEESTIKVCKVKLDRSPPNIKAELPSALPFNNLIAKIKSDEKIKISSEDRDVELFVTISKIDEKSVECSGPFFPFQAFDTPKQGIWILCYYARDRAGNLSTVEKLKFSIDEEPRRLLIEKLIDNAKLNAEKYRYEVAHESIDRAYTEWKNLALSDDQKVLLPLLKSGFVDVLQKSFLKQKKSIESYLPVEPFGTGRAILFREKDIAIASFDKEIVSSHTDLGMIEGYAVHTGNKTFAVGDSDGRIRIIGEKLETLYNYSDTEQSVYQKLSFSKNGKLLAAGSIFGNFIIINISNKRIVLQKNMGSRIDGIAFDAAGTTVFGVVGGAIKSISLDGLVSDKNLGVFDEGVEGFTRLDDKTLLVRTSERLTTIDIGSGSKKDVFSSKKVEIKSVSMSPNAKYISILLDNGTFKILSKDKFTELKLADFSLGKVVAISLGDSKFSVVDINGFAQVIDLVKMQPINTFRIAEGEAVQNAWMDGEILYSATSKILSKFEIANPLLKVLNLPPKLKIDEISDVSLTRESLRIAFRDGTITSIINGQVLSDKTIDGIGFGYTRFGQNFILRFGFDTAMVFNRNDLKKANKTFQVDETSNLESFVWDSLDESFYLGSEGFVKRYDLKGNVGLALQTIQPPYPVLAIAAAENDGPVISGGERRGVISIWPKRDSAVLPMEFDGHVLKVVGLGFVNQLHEFVSVSEDGSIALWNSQGKSLKKNSAHPNETRGLIVNSSDGDLLTIGDDKSLRIWSESLAPLNNVALSAAGKLIRFSDDKENLVLILEDGSAVIVPSSLKALHMRTCESSISNCQK